jgi:hypothetical protein
LVPLVGFSEVDGAVWSAMLMDSGNNINKTQSRRIEEGEKEKVKSRVWIFLLMH